LLKVSKKLDTRAKVINIANNLNIKGGVENIEDSNVRIISQTQ